LKESLMDEHDEDLVRLVRPAVERWRQGIGSGDLEMIASAFTEDALFKGSHPQHSRGRDGVRAYYASQEPGLTVEFEPLDVRGLGSEAAVAFIRADFQIGGVRRRPTHITLIFQPVEGQWLINHYHVSFIE
jgi:uncharacterized protein (TIGR02246 family)